MMTIIEKKTIATLVFIISINLLFLLCYLSDTLSYILSLSQENVLDSLIVFSLLGIHAFFALLTFFMTFAAREYKYRYFFLWGSIIFPFIFFLLNFKTILSYQTNSRLFVLFSVIFFYGILLERQKLQNLFRNYIKTIINPLDGMPF